MRLIKINAPAGEGINVVLIAHESGISDATIYQVEEFSIERGAFRQDVVDIKTSAPLARKFLDNFFAAPFYDRKEYSVTTRQPRSIISRQDPADVTLPVVIPETDIMEDLWVHSHVTFSFAARSFIAALLISYGIINDELLGLAAGLLFLPYVQVMLAFSYGMATKQFQLMKQGIYALSISTLLIVLAGMTAGALTGPPVIFSRFGTPLSGFLIAIAIAIAAGLATADDAGRRELIGLAITAHTSIFPAWIGVSITAGFPDESIIISRVSSYLINLATIIIVSAITYKVLGMKGDVINKIFEKDEDKPL